MSDSAERKEMIRAIISRILNVEAAQIRGDSELGRDLPSDSLDLLEIALKIEATFGISIPDSDYPRLTSLDKICARVEELRTLGQSCAPVH